MTRPRSSSTCRSLLGLGLVASVLGAPRIAEAMSCCGSTLAQPDRLGPCEKLSFQLGAGFMNALGAGLASGIRWNGDNRELDARLRLSSALRLSPAWQVSAEAGWQHGFRQFSGANSTAGAFTDVTLGARLDPPHWDSLAFTATVGLPLGRTMLEASDRFGADVTGRGAFSLRLGAVFQHDWNTSFVVLGLGATGVSAERGSGIDPTVTGDTFAAVGHTFQNRITTTLNAAFAITPALSVDGERLEGSIARRSTLAVSAAYPLSYRSTLLGAVIATPPVGALVRNSPVSLGGTLSFRYALMGGM